MNKPLLSNSLSLWTFILVGFLVLSCSTEKDRWVNRTFHQTTARFNGYFNAGEKLKEGLEILDRNFPDDFTTILPVVKTGDEKASQAIYSYMDEVILKCSNVIQFHSMEIRRKEKNKWIDENYLLIGKARFFKQEYASALQAFDYITRNYPKTLGAVEARIWLARTQLKRGNYNTALGELEFVRDQKNLPRKIKGELYASLAWVNIELGNYDDAIEDLTKALSFTRKKDKKIRYTYILAQLNQELNEFEIASAFYKRVIRYNPPYEFTFNSKINKARCFDVFSGSSDDIIKELEKMIKDDKNIEYLDQIYFALADVYQRDGKERKAIESLKLSVKYNLNNQKQLGASYFTLGEIYFESLNYVPAQMYYDSASRVLNIDHPDYTESVMKRNSLADLVDYVQTISREDSLQALAVMGEDDRNRVIDRLIKDIEQREQQKKEDAEFQNVLGNQQMPNRNNNNTGGAWYFYNTSAISSGFSDFQRKWGRRTLEDNWRRKNKQSQVNFEEEPSAQASADPNKENDPKKREFYLQNVPLTKEAMAASNEKVEEAYYKLGLIYMNGLEDYRAAIKTFKELVDKYPGGEYELRAFYNLYQLYDITGFRSEKELYEARIFKKYPDSDLANLLRDPDYFDKKAPKNQVADRFYKKAYSSFRKGNYDSTLVMCVEGKLRFKDNAINPKLNLLEALATGRKYGVDQMEPKLKDVVADFGGTEVATEAQNLLNVIARSKQAQSQPVVSEPDTAQVANEGETPGEDGNKGQGSDPIAGAEEPIVSNEGANEKDGGNQQEQPKEEPQEEKPEPPSYYKQDLSADHMYVLIVPVEGNDINQFKTKVSDFNMEKFSLLSLIIRNFQMGKNYQLITVRGFNDVEQSLQYFKTVLNDADLAMVYGTTTFNHFVISQANFGTFYGKRDISGYELFFEANLLPLQTEN